MIDERLVQQVTEDLYTAALGRVPGDTKAALARRVAILARRDERPATGGNAVGATS